MKARSLCAATLLAVMGLSLVGGAEVSAANTDPLKQSGKGKVEITEGTTTGDGKEEDPEIPDKPIVDPDEEFESNENTGSIVMQVVSNLDFGQLANGTSTATKQARAAKVQHADDKGDPTGPELDRGAFVQWTDLRINDNSYKIQAKLNTQFTNSTSNHVLKGSTIKYEKGIINSLADTEFWPADLSKVAAGFELAEGTQAAPDNTVVVLDNSTKVDKKGAGTYFLEYGQSDDFVIHQNAPATAPKGTPGTASEAVTLTVPGNTLATAAGNYQAEILWSIAITPPTP